MSKVYVKDILVECINIWILYSMTSSYILYRCQMMSTSVSKSIYEPVVGSDLEKVKEDILKRVSVFLTGKAGSGKTYIINRLYEQMSKTKGVKIYKSASTGIAAYGIEGVTINSFAGYGTLSSVDMADYSEKCKNVIKSIVSNPDASMRIKESTHLIIEEVSMIDSVVLDFLNRLFKHVRGNKLFMGGITVILCGDLLQLRPVSCSLHKGDDRIKTAKHARCWSKFRVHMLTTSYRQTDEKFLGLLNRARRGTINSDDKKLLQSRVKPKMCNNIKALELYGSNRQVDAKNKQMLEKLDGEPYVYYASDYSNNKRLDDKAIRSMNDKYTMYKAILNLKVGARVMLLKNLDVSVGLVNGALGSVLKCTTTYITVKFDNSELIRNISKDVQTYEYLKFQYSRQQFPLTLAYACTIHKAQGITLDKCILNLNKANIYSNDYGKVYVALSRCRTLEGIYIRSIAFDVICADEEIVDWYDTLLDTENTVDEIVQE